MLHQSVTKLKGCRDVVGLMAIGYSGFPARRGRWRSRRYRRVTTRGRRCSSASRNERRSFTVALRGFHVKTRVLPTSLLTRMPSASRRRSWRWMAMWETSKVVAIRRA